MAIDKKLQIFDDEGNPVDYDILASDVKFNDGKDLPTKLAEMEEEIGEGGYTPPPGGIPKTDLAPAVQQTLDDVANKVDKVTGKGLSSNDYTDTDKAKVDGLKTVATSGSYNDLTDQPTIPTVPTMDSAPTAGNTTHMVSSDGVARAIAAASGGESVVINSDGANIVDSHTNPSILVAPSARQMYMAYQNINTLFTKVNDLYDKLAGIAFKDGKPANWKENANWLTPAIPTHTITLGTMSNVSASMNGTAISGSVPAAEGEVTIKLTPSQGAMILTDNITIKLGTENVPFTTAADNGSTLVTFILAGDVTLTASASSGRNINFSGSTGCTIDDVGVAIGEDLDTTIRADEHWTLPASITVKIGNADVTHTYTKAQDGKTAALHIDAANITGDLTITCAADEDAHVMLAVSGSGYTISDGTKTYSNGDKVYNTVQVTLSIAPASGKKFTTLPSSDKGTMTNNGAYAASSLDIGTSVSGFVAISAETADLTNYSVGFQSIANFSVAYTDLSGNAIAAENNVATVVENSGVKIRITPAPDHTLTIGGMTMGDSSVTPSVTTDNGVAVITIEHVTGAVVVSATANEAGAVEITTTANKATVTDNGAKQGGTLVLTVAPSTGYGFKAAEDANDVNRGVILVKDGSNNVIVDTVNGIGLDKVTYGALTKAAINSLYPKYWSRFPSFASTIITIDNAPAAVSVNVASALIFQENAFRDDYTIGNIYRTYPYYRAVNVNSLPCNAAAYIEPVGTVTSTSKCLWGGRATVGQFAVDAHNPSLICCSGNVRTGFWQTTWNQDISLVGKTIDRWSVVFCAGKDANDKPYLESAYLYHYPSGNTSNASDRNVIFDGSDKSLWILVPDDVSPKVVLKGIPEGVVPKRWSSDGTASRSCVKIDGYYTEWGDPGAGITITMTDVSNVTCSDSNVAITESSGTFTIVVSNLTSGEVRNVNLNVTV